MGSDIGKDVFVWSWLDDVFGLGRGGLCFVNGYSDFVVLGCCYSE